VIKIQLHNLQSKTQEAETNKMLTKNSNF